MSGNSNKIFGLKALATTLITSLAISVQHAKATEMVAVNTTEDVSTLSSCSTEFYACYWNSTCYDCILNATDDCDDSYRRCYGLWEILCCMYGTSPACAANEALLEYVGACIGHWFERFLLPRKKAEQSFPTNSTNESISKVAVWQSFTTGLSGEAAFFLPVCECNSSPVATSKFDRLVPAYHFAQTA